MKNYQQKNDQKKSDQRAIKKTAIILFNLGGPDSLKAVKPFLFNLFNDKAIIGLPQPFRFLLAKLISHKRDKKAQDIYAQINGKSPLLEITNMQAEALERELSFLGNYKVFIAMRYWHPFVKETIDKINDYDPQEIILLPLYPQFSSSTTASSIKDFLQNIPSQLKQKVKIKTICCYPTNIDFCKSHALLIKQTLNRFYDRNFSKIRLLFSAHGLPQKLIDAGDPYVLQVEASVEEVVNQLANLLSIEKSKIDYKICYQSKVGPLRWTSPSLGDEIKRIETDNKMPLIIPIAFVSDHSETLVELDIEYKHLAEELKIKNYQRVPALNLDGHFIEALKKLVISVGQNNENDYFYEDKALRFCPKKFRYCQNPNPCKDL